MEEFLIISSFVLGGAGAWLIARFAPVFGLVDVPNSRSSHLTPVPRSGGVGILMAAVLAAVLLGAPLFFWLPCVLLSLVSLWDDRKGVSPAFRLLFQVAAAVATLTVVAPPQAGAGWYLAAGLFWIAFLVATANFFNFMDGIDGMAGISGAVGFGLTGVFAVLIGAESWLSYFSFGLAAACLGFLPFNFPQARVFLGDVGSILLGFMFAVLTACLASDFFHFLVLAAFLLPFYCDALVTLLVRWRKGENLFVAHRQHFYQILVHRKGFSHWQVSALYALAQLLVGMTLMWCFLAGHDWLVPAFVAGFFVLFGSVSLKARRIQAV